MFGSGDDRTHTLLAAILEELRIQTSLMLRPTYAKLHFRHRRGECMPKTIEVGGTAQAVFQEFDQFHQPITGPGPVSFASDNAAVATVDPTSGLCTGMGAGTVNISGTDAGDGLTASDILTVEQPASVPTSATLTLQ